MAARRRAGAATATALSGRRRVGRWLARRDAGRRMAYASGSGRSALVRHPGPSGRPGGTGLAFPRCPSGAREVGPGIACCC